MNFINAFRPLSVNKDGSEASRRFGLPPFIDGSIRREPDLQSRFPSITALCRAGLFAPRLMPGDRLVYVTVKGRYPPYRFPHWRLVALLHVIAKFQSHSEASAWYSERGLPLPSNCLVPGNNPTPVEMSALPGRDPREWELGYQLRARKVPVFLVCDPIYLELNEPLPIGEDDMIAALGRIPGLQNPPSLADGEYDRFAAIAQGSRKGAA